MKNLEVVYPVPIPVACYELLAAQHTRKYHQEIPQDEWEWVTRLWNYVNTDNIEARAGIANARAASTTKAINKRQAVHS